MRDVLQIPVDAVEEGGLGGCFDADVALGAGDAEVVFVVRFRNESQLKLRRKVRHETLEDSLGRCCGGFGARGRRHYRGY